MDWLDLGSMVSTMNTEWPQTWPTLKVRGPEITYHANGMVATEFRGGSGIGCVEEHTLYKGQLVSGSDIEELQFKVEAIQEEERRKLCKALQTDGIEI